MSCVLRVVCTKWHRAEESRWQPMGAEWEHGEDGSRRLSTGGGGDGSVNYGSAGTSGLAGAIVTRLA